MFGLYDPFPELKKTLLQPYIDHLVAKAPPAARQSIIENPDHYWTVNALNWQGKPEHPLWKSRYGEQADMYPGLQPSDLEYYNWGMIHQTAPFAWPHMYYFLYRRTKFYVSREELRPWR